MSALITMWRPLKYMSVAHKIIAHRTGMRAEATKLDTVIAASLKKLGYVGKVALLNIQGFSFNKTAAYLTIVE
jgi:hypothetical protein